MEHHKLFAGEGAGGNERTFSKYPDLWETIYSWCDPHQHEVGKLSFARVVQIALADVDARSALRQAFSKGGGAYERDPEIANTLRDNLAWAIIDAIGQ